MEMRRRAIAKRHVVLAAGLLCLMLGAMFGSTWIERQILFPRAYIAVPEVVSKQGVERRWLVSPEGPVEAWILPGRGVTPSAPGPAVIFAHGNGELIDFWPDALLPYLNLGVTVVLPEYRGYGRSAGHPTEAAIAADLRTLVAELGRHPLIDPDRLVYHGRSLGGGAVCTLLSHRRPRALILESTFTSVAAVAWARLRVPAFFIADKFDSLSSVASYAGPLLVFHGTRDAVIPVEHGKQLAAARPGAELVLYESGHNDLPPKGSDYWERIERFLRKSRVVQVR